MPSRNGLLVKVRQHRRAVIVLGAAVLTGVAAWLLIGQRGFPGLRWPEGQELTYDLRLESKVSSAGDTLIQFQVQGTLGLTPIQVGERTVLRAQLDGSLTGLGGTDAVGGEVLDQVQTALRQPYYVDLAEDGGLQGIRVTERTPDFVLQIWKALAASVQLRSPARGLTWEIEEDDTSGRYLAAYQVKAASEVHKQKRRYTRSAALVSFTVDSSQTVFQLDDQRVLRTLVASEKLDAKGDGPMPSISGVTSLRLQRKEMRLRKDQLTAWRTAAGNAPPVLVNAPPSPDMQRSLDQSRVGNMTFGDAMTTLHERMQLDKGPDKLSNEERDRFGRAYVALVAMLRLSGEHLPDIREHILQGGPLSMNLAGALRDAGTAQAQGLLQELVQKTDLPRPVRGEVARNLGAVREPTVDTVNTLANLRNDRELSTQAHYSLGSNIRRLQGTNPDLADQMLEQLTSALAKANEEDKAMLLTSIGNSAHRGALPHVQAAAKDPSPRIRAAAAQALRKMSGDDVELLLVQLLRDADVDVRTSAVDALASRTATRTLVAALSQLIAGEKAFRVRGRAVQIAVGWLDSATDLRAVLERTAQSDENADIRLIARNALDRRSGEGG
jgi:HEAT repeat protein